MLHSFSGLSLAVLEQFNIQSTEQIWYGDDTSIQNGPAVSKVMGHHNTTAHRQVLGKFINYLCFWTYWWMVDFHLIFVKYFFQWCYCFILRCHFLNLGWFSTFPFLKKTSRYWFKISYIFISSNEQGFPEK